MHTYYSGGAGLQAQQEDWFRHCVSEQIPPVLPKQYQ